jgi:hypothetical protein
MEQGKEQVDVLVEKLNKFEKLLKDEKRNRFRLEEDLKNYKTIIVPTLEKNLEDKESICKTAFIENISLQKKANEAVIYFNLGPRFKNV